MKTLFLSLVTTTLLVGCGTTPSPMTKAAVTGVVSTAASIALSHYPEARPGVLIGESVICATANSTNVSYDEVVAQIQAAGITNQNSKDILNGALAVYNTVFVLLGTNGVDSVPELRLYLGAICDGLKIAAPQPGPGMMAARRELPAHLK